MLLQKDLKWESTATNEYQTGAIHKLRNAMWRNYDHPPHAIHNASMPQGLWPSIMLSKPSTFSFGRVIYEWS